VLFRNARDEKPSTAEVFIGPFGSRLDWIEERLAFDPQEEDPALAEAFLESDRLYFQMAWWRALLRKRGSCYVIWEAQQRMLREKHGIDWRSPTDMNPGIIWD